MNLTHNVGVVVPTHNRKILLKILLTQIRNQIKETFVVNTYVVVDESGNDTLQMLQEFFPEVKPILGTGEWWYTKSINEGMKEAIKDNNDLILLLNDDIEIDNNYLDVLISSIPKVIPNSIIGSLSITKDKPYRVTSSGTYKINRFLGKAYNYHKFLEEVDIDRLCGIHRTYLLPGRGMLIPKNILIKLNFFDETFPQYHSDIDFCLRALENGFNIYVNWNAKLFSHYLMTSNSSSYKKQTLSNFLATFKNPYSRNHILQNIIIFHRHFITLFTPVIVFIWIVTRAKHYFKKK